MSVTSVAVVHLVRFANGPLALEGFLRAYEKCQSPESTHRLVLVCKGFESWDHLAGCLNEWSPVANTADQKLLLPDDGWDLGAYRRAAEALPDDVLIFTNSWSKPRATGWVERLAGALGPDVGIAGATGSLEAIAGTTYPNPHVRTNAFAVRRSLFLDLAFDLPADKVACWLIEAGPHGLTRQVLARGLRAVVVGREGAPKDVMHARETRTFRWGRQENLLVADNQTDDNARCVSADYAARQRAAWGQAEPSSEMPPKPPPLPPPYVPPQTRASEVVFVCPIYDMFPQLVSSLMCQTHTNWRLLLLHNGPSNGGGPRFPFAALEKIVASYADPRIELRSFPEEQGKWGHPLRRWALEEMRAGRIPKGDFVVITNADNYYMPGFAEKLLEAFAAKPDAVAAYCRQMVHSYLMPVGHRWSVLECRPERNQIDCGAVMVRSEAAAAVGWKSHAFAGDWDYFRDLLEAYGKERWVGVPGCLFVHN